MASLWPVARFQNNFTSIFFSCPFAKIAKMVLLCWTKWLPELKIEKKKKKKKKKQPLNISLAVARFQYDFTEMFLLSPFTKIVKMVLLCWTKWSLELKIEKTFKWHLRGQWQDFKIISHLCFSYAPLPKLTKMVLLCWTKWLPELKIEKKKPLKDRISRWTKWFLKNIWTFFYLWRFENFNILTL